MIERSRAVRRFVLSVLVYIISAVATVIMYCTYLADPPVEPADVVIFVSNHQAGSVLTEVRKYVGRTDESITVNRILFQESDPANFFAAESGGFRSMPGEFPVLNTYRLPDWVAGRWCSQVELGFWPAWSQREYTIKTKPVCFEVNEYE